MNYYLQIVLFIASAIGICFILFRGLFFIIDKCSFNNGNQNQHVKSGGTKDSLTKA